MRAIVQKKYGTPADLELQEVQKPDPAAGEVLVRVRAASVHPDVWHMITGRPLVLRLMGAGLIRPTVSIPGTDMAGVVDAVGAGVTRFRPGDAVFGETVVTNTLTNGGAYAEYASVPQDLLEPGPDNVTFEQAASVPTSGYITLMNLRDPRQLRSGLRVLVNGAGGGVGMLALQILKAHGAHVTAVDTASKLDLLRSLGADDVIDYTRDDFTRRGTRYDLIFDIPGNHTYSTCRRVLEPDGRYVVIGHEHYGASRKPVFGLIPHFLWLMLRSRFDRQLGSDLPLPSRRESMVILRELLEAGKITPVIDRAYPLAEFREAFRHMIEDDCHGKVMLIP